jgi:hypothetical protein
MSKQKKSTIEVKGSAITILSQVDIWESLFNSNFNYNEFATIKSMASLNSYKTRVDGHFKTLGIWS